jgi:hypothetical protein
MEVISTAALLFRRRLDEESGVSAPFLYFFWWVVFGLLLQSRFTGMETLFIKMLYWKFQ